MSLGLRSRCTTPFSWQNATPSDGGTELRLAPAVSAIPRVDEGAERLSVHELVARKGVGVAARANRFSSSENQFETRAVIIVLKYHVNPKNQKFDLPQSPAINKNAVRPVITK